MLDKILATVDKIFSSPPPEVRFEERKYPVFPFENAYQGQNSAINAILDLDRVVLCSHTGSGKTVVYLTAALLEQYRTLVVVPRNFLQDQIEEYNEKFRFINGDGVIFTLKAKSKYRCKFGETVIDQEKCLPCEARYFDRSQKKHVFEFDGKIYPYPCLDCEYEKKKNEVIEAYKNRRILCLNQGNFWLAFNIKEKNELFYPEFVVVDEADEFARAITEGVSVREEEMIIMAENSTEIQHLLKKMNKDEILAINENPEMIRKCLASFHEAVEQLMKDVMEKIDEIEEELQKKNLSKSEKDMLKAKLVKLRRQLDYFERKISKITFFANNIDKIFVYTKTDAKNLYFEMFCSEEELITRLFKHVKKLCAATATPFEVSKFVKVNYEVPFKARVIYAPVGKMTFKEVFQNGNTDLLKKAVVDYVIPIHHYISVLLNSKVKTPIHCGSLRRHGTFVADILKNNGQSVLLHEEGKLDETIRKFKEKDYDFLCVVAAEYGADWYWCPLQFVLKVPYVNPYDPRELAIKRRFGEEIWRKRYEWDALSRLIQACGRNTRKPDQFSITVILDKKFEELYAKYENLIPPWFKNRLIWLGGEDESNRGEENN